METDDDLKVSEIDGTNGKNGYFKDYQDPKIVDKLSLVSDKVNQLKEVLHENIEKLLDRGTDIEGLIDKSADLSEKAKLLFK